MLHKKDTITQLFKWVLKYLNNIFFYFFTNYNLGIKNICNFGTSKTKP